MKHVIAVIDRSGSMAVIEKDMNGGIRQWLKDLKEDDPEALVTSVLFDSEYEVTNDREVAKNVKESSLKLVPRGSTALNDALFKALKRIKKGEDALVFVVTDGHENASTEITDKNILKKEVQKLTKKGVQFVYLSASISAFSDAQNYGFAAGSTMAFAPSSAGVQSVSSAIRSTTQSYLSGDSDASDLSKYDTTAKQSTPA